MNQNPLERKLIAAARANPPSDAVPHAFEKRVMTRLGKAPALDLWGDWSRALWRAAAPCVAVAVVLGAWTIFTPDKAQASTNLSQELEAAIFVAVTHDSNSTW